MNPMVIGVFDNFDQAEWAKQQLIARGFWAADVQIRFHSADIAGTAIGASMGTGMGTSASTNTGDNDIGFMDSVRHFFSDLFGSDEDDAGHYSEAVRRGGAVVAVTITDESRINSAREALALTGAVDIERRVAEWRESGYQGYRADAAPYTRDEIAQERARFSPVFEEQLEVGKRHVDLGTVRVVTRMVETPVNESVTLREEHASIERRPADRPASEADLAAFRGENIQVEQSMEKAVISKTARVVEEVVVGKTPTEHNEQAQIQQVQVQQAQDSKRKTVVTGNRNAVKNRPNGNDKNTSKKRRGKTFAKPESDQIPVESSGKPPQPREIQVIGQSMSGEVITRFEPETLYVLRFSVAAPSAQNLARGNVTVADVPEKGLAAHWVVISSNVEFLKVSSAGKIVHSGAMWLAEFDLTIPAAGDSDVVALDVRTIGSDGELTLALLVGGEEYRKLTVRLGAGASVEHDVVSTVPGHLNLTTSHEWTTPPEHIEVNAVGTLARISTVRGANDHGTADWMANSTNLKNPIQRTRIALDKFRIVAEAHLDDLDVEEMDHRLHSGQWMRIDWSNGAPDNANADHAAALTSLASGSELRSLASEGYNLFNTCFPRESKLRNIIEKLPVGSRIDFIWTNRGSNDWVSHVPWALMYMEAPKASEAVNCERFLGLRYRIGSRSWEPNAPSRALGDPAQVSLLHFLYWGKDQNDEVGVESLWQRNEFSKWSRQSFVPSLDGTDNKKQIVAALEDPKPDPAAILYFYCQCSVKDGSDPILQFGETARVQDIIEASDIYQGRIEAGPLVFANACSTLTADPQGTSELESRFFSRDIRAFLGTETKVPVVLASRFAWLFFQFFLRKVDPEPIAAGEALAQARLFLWTQYRNPGGLFYCLVNQYNLYFASEAKVNEMQRN